MGLIDFFSKLETLIGDNLSLDLKLVINKFINIDLSKKEIHIDLSNASPEQISALKTEILPNLKEGLIESEEGYLLEETQAGKDIALIKDFASEESTTDVYKFVTTNLPKQDLSLWLSAMLLKTEYENKNKDKVIEIKNQMVTFAGKRGANIANLCSEGYLETHIMPLHNHLVGELNDIEEFLKLYELIVSDHIFAVFVSKRGTTASIVKEVQKKLDQVKKYGWDRVHIHAINQDNVKKVKMVVLKIQDKVSYIKDIKEVSDKKHIKVTLFI